MAVNGKVNIGGYWVKPLNRLQCYYYVRKASLDDDTMNRLCLTLVNHIERFTRKQLRKLRMNHQLVMIDGKRTFAVEGVTYHLIKAIDSEVDNRIKESKLQQNKISILISLMALVVAIAAYLNT